MKIPILQDINNLGLLPLISYYPNTLIGKKPIDKVDSPKIEIKTQAGEIYSKKVSLYLPIFKNRLSKALLRLLFLLKIIINVQNLKIGSQRYDMRKNIFAG